MPIGPTRYVPHDDGDEQKPRLYFHHIPGPPHGLTRNVLIVLGIPALEDLIYIRVGTYDVDSSLEAGFKPGVDIVLTYSAADLQIRLTCVL